MDCMVSALWIPPATPTGSWLPPFGSLIMEICIKQCFVLLTKTMLKAGGTRNFLAILLLQDQMSTTRLRSGAPSTALTQITLVALAYATGEIRHSYNVPNQSTESPMP